MNTNESSQPACPLADGQRRGHPSRGDRPSHHPTALGRARSICLPWVLVFAASCGGAEPRPAPEASAEGYELTIELFSRSPFVDGDTESAPLVAIQDGDGPWTAITAAHGLYHVHLGSERYGVAIGCRDGQASSVKVFQRTVADGLDLRTLSCGADSIEFDVTVRNVPQDSLAYVSIAGASDGGGDYTYVFHARPGPTELFASVGDRAGYMAKLVRVPTFDLEARRSLTIDFATQGTPPDDHALAVTLGPREQAYVTTSVIRPTGEYLLQSPALVGTPATYAMVPVALRQPDDLFGVTVEVGSRSTSITSKAPDKLTFELPPDMVAPTPAVLAEPFLHPVFAFETSATDLPIQTYQLYAHTAQPPGDAYRDWTAELSAAWIAGAQYVSYTFPDLSGVPGFFSDFILYDREPIRWIVRRTEMNSATASDGRIVRSAFQSGATGTYCGDHTIQPPETCDPPDGTTCSTSCMRL